MHLRDIIGIWLLAALLAACSADIDVPSTDGMGRLRLAIPNVSVITRSTPAALGAPTPGDFHLTITNQAGRAVYDGPFTEDVLILPIGDYTVQATCGTNPQLGIDAPYYIAESPVTILKDMTVPVNLKATVGNALVSAVFGRDEQELARFDRYYSDYALYVHIGNHSIPITKNETSQSIYFRAGSHVSLSFWGKLKLENDREVRTTLESDLLPATFQAADHAIVTLSLPDPESAVTLDISKVELQTMTLEETIPLSWLPVPSVTPTHHYADNGNLAGTDLVFSNSYVGMNWRAVVTNAAGTEVRRAQGTGELTSAYTSSTAWPYLPQGKYKATYYLIDENDKATLTSSREFMVGAPTITVSADAYTSYCKYLAGDIESANACNRLTVYEPSVRLGIEQSLLKNSNYSYTFTYTYDGTATAVPAGRNSYFPGDISDQAVRREPHIVRADATFDGINATHQKEVFIIGLPYSLNLASHEEWVSSSGVDWYDNDVRLGHLSTGSQSITTSTAICLPMGTYFCADYSVNVHTLTVGTYFSINAGNNEILKIEEAGTPFNDMDHMHSGTTEVCHDDNQYLTTITCYNDYGAGQTCSHIYSLTFKYASH